MPVSDGAMNFKDAFSVFYTNTAPRTKHIREIAFNGERHNKKMERMNGEVRDREKTVRGVRSVESPIFAGSQIFHNYIRPHMNLDGKTPADSAGIKVEGSNKWMTLIQNVSKEERCQISHV